MTKTPQPTTHEPAKWGGQSAEPVSDRGKSVEHPAQEAPFTPLADNLFRPGHQGEGVGRTVEPPDPAATPKEPSALEKSIGRALDEYQLTHTLNGWNARGHLTQLIVNEVEGKKHAAKADQAEDNRSRER